MEKFFSQKLLFHKNLLTKSLLLLVLLTFSGCAIDFRDRYSFTPLEVETPDTEGGGTPSPEPEEPTFIQQFAEKSDRAGDVYEITYKATTVNGYERSTYYVYDGSRTLTIGDTKYTYIGDSTKVNVGDSLNNETTLTNYIVGNFDSFDNADGSSKYRVQVMIDCDSDNIIVIKPREVKDYFVTGKKYGNDNYTAGLSSDGLSTLRDEDTSATLYYSYTYGKFTEAGGEGVFAMSYSVDVKIDPAGNITVTK